MSARLAVETAFVVALATCAVPVAAGVVTVVAVDIEDNGDSDGIGDTGETLDLTLTLENTGATLLTGVEVKLVTRADTAHLGCAVEPSVAVGSLMAGEVRQTPPGLTIAVPQGVERVDLYERLTAFFDVRITSDQIVDAGRFDGLGLELDLDLSGGSTPTGYLEDFESAVTDLGDFVEMNLDAGLGTYTCSIDESSGYRCQRSVPWCGASCTSCEWDPPQLGASELFTELYHWSIDDPGAEDGGRAFSGQRSLYMGVRLPGGLGRTTPLSTLEAVGTGTPIHVGWDRVCATTRSTACVDASGCPSGESCVPVRPVLSIVHQISLADERLANVPQGDAVDRGVVQVRLLDGLGAPVGVWQSIAPFANAYDATSSNFFSNPMFDPTDDGNVEWDWFPDVDWGTPHSWRAGPSSTCFPQRVFAHLGDTDAPFDPLELGNADGPGIPGALGPGTWVESRFPLDRFRGRTIQIRFVVSTLKVGLLENWKAYADAGGTMPESVDDGWWIDDVTVSDTLQSPAGVAIDLADNTALPAFADVDADGVLDACDLCPATPASPQWDVDADGFGNACDCGPVDPVTYPGAPETYDGIDNQCPGDFGFGLVDEFATLARFENSTRFEWVPILGATNYQVIRSTDKRLISGCTCNPTPDAWFDDAAVPPPGLGFYYVAQVLAPTPGSSGADSDGNARFGRCVVDICAP